MAVLLRELMADWPRLVYTSDGRIAAPGTAVSSALRVVLHNAMIAELLDRAVGEPGPHRLLHGRDVPALMAGQAGGRRDGDRAGKAVIAAFRASADRAEDEIAGHGGSFALGERSISARAGPAGSRANCSPQAPRFGAINPHIM